MIVRLLCDGDGHNERREALQLPAALGQDADNGQRIFPQLVVQLAQPPAEHDHISGGED